MAVRNSGRGVGASGAGLCRIGGDTVARRSWPGGCCTASRPMGTRRMPTRGGVPTICLGGSGRAGGPRPAYQVADRSEAAAAASAAPELGPARPTSTR